MIRHGETDWNIKYGRLQGHTDIPLNEKGRQQAKALGRLAANLGITKIFSSDLERARETAELLALCENTFLKSRDLREVNLGIAEGLTWEEIGTKMGDEFRTRWSGSGENEIDMDLSFPDGESRRQVLERVSGFILQTLRTHPEDRIAFVTHGFVIRAMVQHLSPLRAPFFVPNCAVVPFAYDPGRGLIYTGPDQIEDLLQPRENDLAAMMKPS